MIVSCPAGEWWGVVVVVVVECVTWCSIRVVAKQSSNIDGAGPYLPTRAMHPYCCVLLQGPSGHKHEIHLTHLL